jgi:hypothetical protein
VEVVLLNSIVPESNRRKPLDDLTTRALGDILADCDFVSRVANRLIGKGDFNMVLCLIMLFRTIMSIKPSVDTLISVRSTLLIAFLICFFAVLKPSIYLYTLLWLLVFVV